MVQAEKRVEYISYSISYVLAFTASRQGLAYLAGIVLMLEALFLYLINLRRTGSLVDLKGLFSLSWIGGEGIACLQLSRLQRDWELITWICFFLAYFFFLLGYDLSARRCSAKAENHRNAKVQGASRARRVMICILLLSIGSVSCFLLEALVLGFIPLFSPEPHAYSYFHISGVHYFTVSCILIPALSVLYVKLTEKWNVFRIAALAVGNLLAVGIPILCVSRFQLLFAVGFAAVVYLMLYRHVTWKMIAAAVVILIPVYVLLTVARRHNITYLNGIFEMKYSKMPIFITQPYIYVANNYENFNCMVRQLPEFAMGLRMLFPVFALTGLKFVFPQVAAFPLYTTKEELTTVTLFYDAYYDFGIAGIILLASLLGVGAAWLSSRAEKSSNPVVYLFYGQIAIYLGLSFFTTWFSNPTTWFWLALTFMMYLFIGYEKKELG
ncbi:MAG: oligosaccharide repeat unit polymerase [Ruminococcus sp.]|nr:oligosaccharide repeat unit polymerase [Ruminococcus sp.]